MFMDIRRDSESFRIGNFQQLKSFQQPAPLQFVPVIIAVVLQQMTQIGLVVFYGVGIHDVVYLPPFQEVVDELDLNVA